MENWLASKHSETCTISSNFHKRIKCKFLEVLLAGFFFNGDHPCVKEKEGPYSKLHFKP